MASLTITAANVVKSSTGRSTQGIAGVAITAGQCLYKDTTDSNKMKLFDANGTAPANVFAGIALHAASANQPILYVTEDPEFTTGATDITLGAGAVYAASTPGAMTQTIGDLVDGSKIVVVGVPVNGDGAINLKPVTGGTITV